MSPHTKQNPQMGFKPYASKLSDGKEIIVQDQWQYGNYMRGSTADGRQIRQQIGAKVWDLFER